MKYWWIIQSLESYDQHADMIGCSLKKGTDQPIHKQFSKIKKGDNIVYYATGDKALLGIFEVTSEMEILKDDTEWSNIAIYKIKPAIMPTTDYYLDWKKLLFDPDASFDLFPNKDRWPYKIWNRYIHLLTQRDYETIKNAILTHKYESKIEVEEKTISERLGPAFGTIDLLFEPVDEMGGCDFIVCWIDDVEEKLKKKLPDIIDLKKELSNIYSRQPRY